MSKEYKSIGVVAWSTLGSRILGLIRDILIFSMLGVSGVSSAFILAFTLPNLFRRLLGEGALTSAFVPVLSDVFEHDSKEHSFDFLNQVLTRIGIILIGLTAIGIVCLFFIAGLKDLGVRWYLASHLGMVLFPYVILVCLAALLGAAINVIGYFAVPALSSIWLNFSMILGLLIGGYIFPVEQTAIAYYLCIGVLLGGVVQVSVPLYFLRKKGFRFSFSWESSKHLRNLFALLVPGLAGAAIIQVNIAATRFLAFSLNAKAVSVLYLANRLIELPLGLFTIAVATVIFPSISRYCSKSDWDGFSAKYHQGIRLIFAISIPASIGLIILAKPILSLFFEWGSFNESDVLLAYIPVCIFALAIPFYSLATFATRGLHAFKDTRTPVKIGFWTFVINLILSLIFMNIWGINGLAAANLLSIIFQSIALQYCLKLKRPEIANESICQPLPIVFFAVFAMSGFLYFGKGVCEAYILSERFSSLIIALFLIPLSVGVYTMMLWWLKFSERDFFKILLVSALRRKSSGASVKDSF